MTGENETKTDITVNSDDVVSDAVSDAEAISVAEEGKEDVVDEAAELTSEPSEINEGEVANEEEIISEFAPEPIKIPNFNKEKEMRKVEKAVKNEKIRKAKKRKNSKKRKKVKKAIRLVKNIVLYILLMVVAMATLASLLVKLNTSEYSLKAAVRSHKPEEFIVGKIKEPEKINLKTSAPNAAIADILRDNSIIIVTYADIKQAVDKSTYPDFIGKIAYDITSYYIKGSNYKEITEDDIAKVLMENASNIKLITGRALGENACKELAQYIMKSDVVKEIAFSNVSAQKATKYTDITSILFSTTTLVALIVALMLLMLIVAVSCKGIAHKMIGWSIILSGAIVGVFGFLFKPMFKASSEFVKCVLNAVEHGFQQSAIVCSAVALLIGVFVMLIGKAMSDDDEEEYEHDYIDEIEQVSTAK